MSEDPPKKRRWTAPTDTVMPVRPDSARAKKKSLTPSSKAWVERQLADPYVTRAKAEGWRSRAAFKLLELDQSFGLLKRGARVVDLGVAPGGWTQAALKAGAGAVVGIDLLHVTPIPGAILLEMDFLEEESPAAVIAALGAAPTLVLSDMAANTTGHQRTDQIRTGALAEAAARFALETLAPGGGFVTKAFQGGLDAALLQELKKAFATVRHAKPKASRSESPEVYLVAQGFRGR